jgi:hypothetical protein
MSMSDKSNANADLRNRKIEQDTQGDAELESVVPPTSRFGGMTTWMRAGLAALGVVIILLVLSQAL